jgi:hypothetical protein
MLRATSARERWGGRGLGSAGLAVLAGLAGALQTQAQYPVDSRVNPVVRQDGRLLDANPSLRGGRYNNPRPVSPTMSGNAFANGNIRGGMALRSFSPIADSNAFRATLGSASLYTFQRDSVSVADAGAPLGFAGFGQPYYDTSRTAASGRLLQGRDLPLVGTVPGRGVLDLRMPVTEAQRDQYAQMIAPTPGTAQSTQSTLFGPLTPPRLALPLAAIPPSTWRRETAEEKAASGTDSRFNTDESTRAAWGRRMGGEPLSTPLDTILQSDGTGRMKLSAPDSQSPPWAAGWRGGQLRPGLIVPRAAAETDTAPGGTATVLTRPRVKDASVLPGYDVFTDMRLALALEHSPTATWFKDMQDAARAQPELAPTPAEQAKSAAEFTQKMLKTPLRSFTGGGASAVNDQILKAESLMEIGHYYEAADRYAAACTMDPTNPLPLLGRGHALLAAGDYRSAAFSLLRGLERFPEIARFAFDLKALMGGGEQIDIRRADILARLHQRESPELLFLLGYLEYHTGDHERGMADLEKAARLDQKGTIISRYPAMLRGEGVLPPPRFPGLGPAEPTLSVPPVEETKPPAKPEVRTFDPIIAPLPSPAPPQEPASE